MEHWKYGDGFAIRYGGNRGIEWFHDEEFRRPGGNVLIPPAHPAALAIEAAKAIGLILQWWEMRKQGQLLAAQFEERRVHWVADMLMIWGADVANGKTLRLDSSQYLEREFGRLMTALIRTPKMDVPAVLLLQVERTSLALVDLNRLLHAELSRQIASISSPERDGLLVPEYQPFNEIRSLVHVPSRPATFFDEVKKRLPRIFASDEDPFLEYLKQAKRRSDFSPIENVMLELRGAIGLLQAAELFPATVRIYSKNDVLSGASGVAVVLSEKAS